MFMPHQSKSPAKDFSCRGLCLYFFLAMNRHATLGIAMNNAGNRNWTSGFFGALACLLGLTLGLLGCGSGTATGTATVAQYYGNYHVPNWITEHPGQAMAGLDNCTKCHEISIIRVGSGVPNCMTTGCHHKTVPTWATAGTHGVRAKMAKNASTGGSLASCQICHGKDFKGGGTANACSTCHGVVAPHPVKPWLSTGTGSSHTTTDPSNAPICAQCHYAGSPNNPVGHPASPAPAGTQPDCFNATLCHANPAPHAVPFLAGQVDTHGNGHMTATAAQFAADCGTCHAHSGASPSAVAPLCNVCHKIANPTVVATGTGTCLSCHAGASGLPAGPTGTAFPNIGGAHSKHMGLATTLTCNTCHANAGAGSLTHYNSANYRTGTPAGPAPVSLDTTYNAKGGVTAFNATALTCSASSCHGGQTTPNWRTGTINSSTQCTVCHGVAATAGVATQFNDAFGRHSQGTHNALNAANAIACTTCHNMANGSAGALAHFKYLNTPAVDGVSSGTPADQMPSGTIAFDSSVTGTKTYTGAQGNGGCALTCHTHVHTAAVNGWTTTGTPHPVPFLAGLADIQGNKHTTVTAAQFTADCGLCHAYTGTSPNATAPLCSTCHAVANPTVAATGAGTCLSCHSGPSGLPAGPTGAAFPSIAGAHAKHMALPTTLTCDSCHTNAGSGTTTHYTNAYARVTPPTGPATVSIEPAFNAKTGVATFVPASLTCSSTNCHGGQTTPNWRTGTLVSSTQCSSCHAVASSSASVVQYNDAYGRHSSGTHNPMTVANAISCNTCHSMTNGSPGAADHFRFLRTANIEGLASGTIVFDNTVTGPKTYSTSTAVGDGGCALTCHTHIHVATVNTWLGAGTPHPVPFGAGQTDTQGNGHFTATAAQFTADCGLCHAHTGTSPTAEAPLCSTCHKVANPTVVATGTGTCLSCHAGASGLPAGPTGTAFPSIAGSHAKHMGLPTTLTCDTCHANAGTGTATHYSNANYRVTTPTAPATVSIATTFSAKSGAATFTPSALTCSATSCHGGKTTPSWTTGTINSLTQCTACHGVASTAAGSAQFNDAFGRHSLGTHNATVAANAISCTTCHNMGNGTPGALAHFKYLNTPAVDGVSSGTPSDQMPSWTIAFDSSTTGAKLYTTTTLTQGNGSCALTCHSRIHTDAVNTWTGAGIPHPIPFGQGQTDTQGNGHFTATAAQFTADCGLCHAYTGTSPAASAPLCSDCHKVANPTLAATGIGTCLSCHVGAPGLTDGPTGVGFPNIAGAHAKHMGLATALTCDSCHASAGTGTATHYTNANYRLGTPTGPATVNIDATFKSKTGGAQAFSPSLLTCSNISCHGGQATPSWQTGTILSASQCTSCHAVSAAAGTVTQHNDAFGRHSLGSHDATVTANGIACTTCHAMSNGTPGALAHFKYLNTPAVDGVSTGVPADQMPSGTIVFDVTDPLLIGARTYTISTNQGDGGCAMTCHTHVHTTAVNTWTAAGTPHPVPFGAGQLDTQGNGHFTVTATQFTADCGLCHVHSGTSSNAAAPNCNVCHTSANPTVVATGAGTCLSCHVGASGLPNGPEGAVFPSVAGAHAKHLGLPTTLTCDTCHANAGTETATHYTNANHRLGTPTGPATVSIDATYNAQSGTASFSPSALTCSAASCHGGQTTPNWRTGTINSATQCTTCHAINGGTGVAQYNDAVGRHDWGTHKTAGALDCTICHAMGNGTQGALNHFAELNTHAVNGPSKLPSTTINFNLSNPTYPITGAAAYTINATYPDGDGGCALSCHSMGHTNDPNHWGAPKGSGVAHPVPFTYAGGTSTAGNQHQTVTLAQFNGDCVNCHEENNPTSTMPGPSCTKCHTNGSPLATGKTAGTCLSCHVGANFTTKGPQGAAWPNLPGAHAKHTNLLTFTRTTPALPAALTASLYPICEACHVGSVPGDALNTHYSNASKTVTTPISAGPASVSVSTVFKSKVGTITTVASASAFTCSSVSCHGGQTTPGWQAGTTVVNADTYCITCHVVGTGTNQYNEATGRHRSPTKHQTDGGAVTCNHCHDLAVATNNKPGVVNHFKYLDTTAVWTAGDQLPSDTVVFGGGATPATGAKTYTVNTTRGQGGCALSCHGQSHTTSGNIWN